uniref:AAA domain-containing protein, putative AbiEii toxin, Type IV TA system n=1 Tax=Candidatus Kentrum sp. FW TaxID=2126338 RepID=A0A450SJQ3_9GAMM|nr:MAG: AAA domain-containing protein, putative AbiEii toxin, Type IV TA system [Candidatus Kentron sp. FW]
MTTNRENPFPNGATWLRADFHLHTDADGEFSYEGDPDYFYSDYMGALEKAGIRIAIITNHNKFHTVEFEALRKTGKKKGIFLLPGVELSVNDGANGIHVLIVFADEWLGNDRDYINQFLNIAFEGKTPNQYENENGRSSLGLIETIKRLEGYHKDFFLVFAHVEQKSGLWNELEGGRLDELGRDPLFRRRTLGFQKVRTRNSPDKKSREKVRDWLKGAYPAEVEGSDPKCFNEIGKGEPCFLKVSAFSFSAVKYALMDHANRVAREEAPRYRHSYIDSIRFEGGTLTGKTVRFSPELNTLIGIRGSGKSSILEVLRYTLDIPFGDKSGDQKYKQELVGFTLGGGGKVVIHAIDRYGQPYEIRRVWKEDYSTVFIDDKSQPGVSIRETVLHKPLYFGQKDLSSTGEGFEKDLVEKLLGSKLDEVRRGIADQKAKVVESINGLMKIADVAEKIAEQENIKQDTEHRLKLYQEHGLGEKLQKQLNFDADLRAMKKGVDLVGEFAAGLRELLAQHEDELRNFVGHRSKHNAELFRQFEAMYTGATQTLDTLRAELTKTESLQSGLSEKHAELVLIREGLVEEFADIERKIAEELKTGDIPNISSEEFLELKKRLVQADQFLALLSKQAERKDSADSVLVQELQTLDGLWDEEFRIIEAELDKVGMGNSSLAIASEHKGDRGAFLDFMKGSFRGSGIRETTFQGIIGKYPDFVAIYRDLDNAKRFFGNNPQRFTDLFMENLKTLLTYQVPNRFTITYRGKELAHHSLGQRASALILFVLSQRENDVIIIDQPEDDLDNQTIYEDVIKLVRNMKPGVQFIFATHNPNIPVLGDADQIQACTFMDDAVSVQSGGIDDPAQQKTIVEIMEGGREAFDKRKEIYEAWKPWN